MKRLLLLSGISFLYIFSNAQTIVPAGNVSGTWTFAGSPYLVQGNITIPNAATLSIEPGVAISFEGSFRLQVNGRLLAVGTETDSISFTAASTINGWQGIRFDNTNPNNDTSRISYSIISYGYVNGLDGGGIYIRNFSKLVVAHSSITNCSAYGARLGGGIFMSNSSATISHNTIAYNHSAAGALYIHAGAPLISDNYIAYNDNSVAPPPGTGPEDPGHDPDNEGGGISCLNCNAVIINNTVSYNHSVGDGGGIWAHDGQQIIRNNILSYNESDGDGGGLHCNSSYVCDITENTVMHNFAQLSGGGIYNESNAVVYKNKITENSCKVMGGGIVSKGPQSTIHSNLIANNWIFGSSALGGALACMNNDSATHIYNNIIANNTSTSGGGILCFFANATFSNNTIVNNHSENGGAFFLIESSPSITSELIFGNTATATGNQFFLADGDCNPAISYSNVPGGTAAFGNNGNFYTGTFDNNLTIDPLFVSPSNGSGVDFNGVVADWSLQNMSAAINAGPPAGIFPATDFLDNRRVVAYRIDHGAIENQVGPDISRHKILFIDKKWNSCANLNDVAVRTKNMRHVVGLQGTISWDTAVVKFNSVTFGTSAINITASNINLTNASNGYLTYSWNDQSFTGKTTADSTALFSIQFSKGNVTIADTADINFSSLHTPLEIDTLNLSNSNPVIATDTSFLSGAIGFIPVAPSVNLAFASCDSIVYKGISYFSSTQFTDTVRYSSGSCDSVYKHIAITIYGQVTPTVSIAASNNDFVFGTPVTFTATTEFEGDAPLYQWFKNGQLLDSESTNAFTSATLNAGDTVYVLLKSNLTCVVTDTASSNRVVLLVKYNIAGVIKNPAGNIISSVNVTAGDSLLTTSVTGNYNVLLQGATDYIVHPRKTNDVNKTNGITTLDIALIQSHILNAGIFNSPYKFIAADVNRSGNVSAIDILYIRRLILGLDTTLPNNTLWAFVDTSVANFNPLNPLQYKDSISLINLRANQPNLNFIGVKLGDVNFDWNPAVARPQQPSTTPIDFYYDDVLVNNNEEIRLPIKVKNFKAVLGLQFTLNFNYHSLQWSRIENNRLNLQFADNHKADGKLTFIWNDAANTLATLNDDDVLMELVFIKAASFNEEDISITSDITMNEAWDGHYNKHLIVKTAGRIIASPATTQNAGDWGVAPNPTRGIVNVTCNVSANQKVHLDILNATGKIVLQKQLQLPAGVSVIKLNLEEAGLLANGIYYLKVSGDGLGNKSRKIILAK